VLVLAVLPLYTSVIFAGISPDRPSWTLRAGVQMPDVVPLAAWERVLSPTFCAADFLASGAMIVSLGVALATWVRRLGRAIAVSVVAYFLTGIGWLFLLETILSYFRSYQPNDWVQRNRWLTQCLMSLSPIAGGLGPIEALEMFWNEHRERYWVGLSVVILIKVAAAGLLLWLSVRTFDRFLGRVPESPPPAREEKPVVLEELVASET
jgi:hypothetical protein